MKQLSTIALITAVVLVSENVVNCQSVKSSTQPTANLIQFASPFVKSLLKETLAYMAAPIFMPIAIGRTFRSPPGLGADYSPVGKFALYLLRLASLRRNDAEDELKKDLFHLLTNHRRNTVLTMKQYRQMERSEKWAKSLRKNHRKLDLDKQST